MGFRGRGCWGRLKGFTTVNLFHRVDMWVPSFSALLTEVGSIVGAPEEGVFWRACYRPAACAPHSSCSQLIGWPRHTGKIELKCHTWGVRCDRPCVSARWRGEITTFPLRTVNERMNERTPSSRCLYLTLCARLVLLWQAEWRRGGLNC